MPDDLDDLLRRAMKSLDDQVPSGYFDRLPEQTLARLEAGMQSTRQGNPDPKRAADPKTSAAVPAAVKDEDSGLHDIRNLAQSTKQRLSNRRVGTGTGQQDVLAQSSAGWKAVALPEPAKMVSLPSIDELPSKAEVRAKESARPATPVEREDSAPAVAARELFARPAPRRRTGRTLAFVGLGLAAAAGVTLFVMSSQQDSKSESPAKQVARVDETRSATPATAPAAAVEAKNTPQVQPIDEPAPAAAPAPDPAIPDPAVDRKKTSIATNTAHRPGGAPKSKAEQVRSKEPEAPPPPPVDKKVEKKGNKDDNEPSFDALLKQAGVDENAKKVVKPKLDKKELTGDDFKQGMNAIAGRAQACYKGTQGTASAVVMVAPSGHVSSVKVTGQFAGKPEAECVSNAVKSATFPAWDGGPQHFTYPFLLSE
jgi:hypothetical protein